MNMPEHSPDPRSEADEQLLKTNSSREQHRQEEGGSDEPPLKRCKPSIRRRDSHTRTRVSRACDRCKTRKTRCTGDYPCYHCSQVGMPCSFNATYRRGRLPSIELAPQSRDSYPAHSASASSEEVIISDHHAPPRREAPHSPSDRWLVPQANEVPRPSNGYNNGHTKNGSTSTGPNYPRDKRATQPAARSAGGTQGNSSLLNPDGASRQSTDKTPGRSVRNSPEPAQVDQQGYYVGPASGASFLLRIQRKLQQQTPSPCDASIFTFGDLPLPGSDSSVVILPPRNEADELLARYFEFSSPTHRFLHRPTVQKWLDELCETRGAMRDQWTARGKKAVLFMVFALASNHPKDTTGPIDVDSSADYFHAADDQLAGEKGATRLTSVQARLAQCLYLLSHSRLNHCWTLFGATSHLALALGIHRKRHGDMGGNIDHVEVECRKRTFWCLYNIDSYLSAALGRPRSFHDDDIDQELPSRVDDLYLQPRHMAEEGGGGGGGGFHQSIMFGSISHFRLSRIVANILKDFYGISSRSTERQLEMAAQHTTDLDSWRATMAHLLDTTTMDSSYMLPIFLRQRNVLSLAFWHAKILLYRPFLLNSFASLKNYRVRQQRSTVKAKEIARYVGLCLDAGLQIVRTVDAMFAGGQMYGTFWFTNYFAFCAIVVLYVDAIQRRDEHGSEDEANRRESLQAAARCQWQMSSHALPGSLPERYGVVLSELRLELLRHNPGLRNLFPDVGGDVAAPAPMLDVNGITASQHHHHEQQQHHSGRGEASISVNGGGEDGPAAGGAGGHLDIHQMDGGEMGDQQGFGMGMEDLSPSSSIAQMTGWPRFDSLVSGGVGGWEDLLSEDPGLDGWTMGTTSQL